MINKILNTILTGCIVLSFTTSSVFAANPSSTQSTEQYQQDFDVARDQANKQLKETYAKNKEQAEKEAKKQSAGPELPPPKAAQPLWEQAVGPKNGSGVNNAPPNMPATPPPTKPADPSAQSQLPNPFRPDPQDAGSPAQNPPNIFQGTTDQTDTTYPNLYR
jgi:hypothetical protein